MPRPKNKTELLDLSQKNYKKLMSYINSKSTNEQEKEFPERYLNRNIRDVLCHLHHWHLMMKEWHNIGMAGQKPDMPAKGYTWKTTPELNALIQKQYESTPLEEAKDLLADSFDKIQSIINRYSNMELFEKKRYKWTGTTSMGSYLVSATSSHYDWAFKLIKKCFK
ncbi:MAG: ClbS/DfsB family four-helix bundle protein [Bacteroidia bacterium]